jgi:hypothetical protein
MTSRKKSGNPFALRLAIALFVLATFAGFTAQAGVVDYVGFGWETGTIVPSDPGDELFMAFKVTEICHNFGVNLLTREGTVYVHGLISEGGVDNMGNTMISYTGGEMLLYADPLFDSDWGINPPNATVPSTFINGELIFSGAFTSFQLMLGPFGGAFEGYLNGTGGSALDGGCVACAYTFAGTFSTEQGANIPEGYEIQIDGMLEVDDAVSVENMSFDSVKLLYR